MNVPGLQNSGNTCFFNGVLQALASSSAILKRLQRIAAAADEACTAPPPLPDSLLQALEALQPASGLITAVRCDDLLAAVREHHRDVLSWGDQHDAAEAFELLSDGVITQLQQWVAGSLAPGLLMPSLAHLQALSQLPACMGIQAAELPSPARLFGAWRQLVQLPLVGMLRDDSVCLSCRTPASSQLTPFTLLNLPIAPTLQHCLDKFAGVAYVHGIDCTRCSLRASMRTWHEECDGSNGSLYDSATLPSTGCAGDSPAAAAEVARLQQLADGNGPLPEADFAEQLQGLGLPWRAHKTSRLKRCCVARAPEVLGLHFRRVQWTAAGQQVKVPGHISFPARLPAAALHAAAPHGFGLANGMLPSVTLPADLRPPEAADGSVLSTASAGIGAKAAAADLPVQQMKGRSTPCTACKRTCQAAGHSAETAVYDLTAVVVHQGGPQSGHYTAFRRIDKGIDSAARWVSASDASVRESSMEEALNAEATLLLYCRRV